jgi:DNA-binding CsgD family transcriptional regulator
LSNREWDVLKLLLEGKSNKLIALSLGISVRTVEFHLTNIYAKFQVNSRIELILKLGGATGWSEVEELGLSTVGNKVKIAENRDRLDSWMNWATTFRKIVSIIGKELEMKTFWASWFLWIIANTIGAATGLAITLATISIIGVDKDGTISLVLVIVTGICIGVSQWLMIRKYAIRAVLWVVASVFGVLLGAIAIGIVAWIANMTIGVDRMSKVMQGAFSIIVPLTLYGASVGFMQWLFLRKYTIHENTKWWVLASILGAALLGIFVGDSMVNIAEVVLVGTIPAITTGFVWAMILKQPSIISTGKV